MTIASSDVNLGGLAFRKQMGWDLFSGFFSGRPFFGYANYSISLFNLLVQLIPIHSFLEWFYGGVLEVGSLAMVWFLRLWSLSWWASMVGALVGFWVNSILLCAAGHVYKLEVLAFSMVSLVFIEKGMRAVSARGQVGYALLTGVSVGLMMLEQQDVALLAGLFLAPYALLRCVQLRWVGSGGLFFLAYLVWWGCCYLVRLCSSHMIKIFGRLRMCRAMLRQSGIILRSGVWCRVSGRI
jgi:hypothetical protein